MSDLASSDIMPHATEEKLMSIITESNAQKIRYELKDDGDGQQLRALSKTERADTVREQREQRRNRQKDPEDESQGAQGGWEPRTDRRQRVLKADDHGHGGDGHGGDPRPTFEQQLRDGFRPVYQGDKIIAMIRDDETTRPGRGAPDHERGKGDGKGSGKGHRNQRGGHREGGGYPDRRDYQRDDRQEEGQDMQGADSRGGEGGDRPYRHDDGRAPRRDRDEERRPRWRVNQGQDVILRDTDDVQSTVVATLHSGALVVQISDEKILPNGIIRMQVEVVEPNPGASGWVTRTAEAAGGPVFFRPDRPNIRDQRGGPGRGRYGADQRGYEQRGYDRRGDRGNDQRAGNYDQRGGDYDQRGGGYDQRGGGYDQRGGGYDQRGNRGYDQRRNNEQRGGYDR